MTQSNSSEPSTQEELAAKDELREANTCIGLGMGVGALGVGAAIVTGAVCPLCYVVPPALIGAGIWKRCTTTKKGDTSPEK